MKTPVTNPKRIRKYVFFIMFFILVSISPRFLFIQIPDASIFDLFLGFFLVFLSFISLSLGISDLVD
ncbi:MAG: hypothetical protein VX368_03165 [Thermoproteota archaeon]